MNHLFESLLRLGDNSLVLGHRMSEWCGHGPVLEEDIALANTALDLIGQAQLWLELAASVEADTKANGRSANDLAFLRDSHEFRNVLLVEQPNRDFGHTIMRQFLFDAYQVPYLNALQESSDQRIADIACKVSKEAAYHLQRSSEVVVALGDGTEESHNRMQKALDRLWAFSRELLLSDDTDLAMQAEGIVPPLKDIVNAWETTTTGVLSEATLVKPTETFAHEGGKSGVRHTEHLGHMLATMQSLQRSYPNAQW